MVKKLFERINVLVLVFSLVLIVPMTACFAADFTLAWDQNPEDDLLGYRLYYKAGSSIVPNDQVADMVELELANPPAGFEPENPSHSVEGLQDDVTYYFVVSAYNATGESSYSDEVSGINGAVEPIPSSGSGGGGGGSGGGCFVTALFK